MRIEFEQCLVKLVIQFITNDIKFQTFYHACLIILVICIPNLEQN